MGLQTLHMQSAKFFPLPASWKPDILRPAFDFVDKDSVLKDGGKARKKEPGTPNGYMAEQPANLNRAVS